MALVHRRTFMAASVATVVAPHLARAQATDADNWSTITRQARDAAYNSGAAVSAAHKLSMAGSPHRRPFAHNGRNTLIWPMARASGINGISFQARIRRLHAWSSSMAGTGKHAI